MSLGRIICLSTLLLAACSKTNGEFCEGHADDPRCAPTDGSMKCSSSSECTMPGAMVCDVSGTKTCVECTPAEATTCGSTEPVCGDDNACRRCESHAECASSSSVCLPDGSCAAETDVAYVSPTGTAGNDCKKTTPCTFMKALSTTAKYIKVSGTINEQVTINNRNVTVLADPNAKLTDTSNGILLKIEGSSQVVIYDLEIAGGSGAANPGISLQPGNTANVTLTRVKVTGNQGVGIASAGGTLIVTQSTVSGNAGGGISVSGTGTFQLTNNVIVYNGTATGPNAGPTGGVLLVPNNASSKFERNTVAFNMNDGSLYRAGVTCAGAMVSAVGNIIYANTEGTTTDDNTQKAGNCGFGNSLVLGNSANHLGLKTPTMTPFDFHLTTASPASVVNAGGACTGPDFDGEMRPLGGACDLGADELTQ